MWKKFGFKEFGMVFGKTVLKHERSNTDDDFIRVHNSFISKSFPCMFSTVYANAYFNDFLRLLSELSEV